MTKKQALALLMKVIMAEPTELLASLGVKVDYNIWKPGPGTYRWSISESRRGVWQQTVYLFPDEVTPNPQVGWARTLDAILSRPTR